MTALIVFVLVVLTIAAIVTSDDPDRLVERLLYCSAVSRREAKRLHPSNHGRAIIRVEGEDGALGSALDTAHLRVPQIASAVIIPLTCPVCDVTFGYGYLNEHDGKAFGWIEKQHHECPKADAA